MQGVVRGAAHNRVALGNRAAHLAINRQVSGFIRIVRQDADHAGFRHQHGAIGERVRADGRQANGRHRRKNDRAAGRQRVRGRAGGCRHDEGVGRIDITNEYVRAALDYHLSYQDLKQLARTGMEHNFLPGKSLWAAQDVFSAPVAACKAQTLGSDKPTADCKAFLDGSEKAAVQWELERRFRVFEGKW